MRGYVDDNTNTTCLKCNYKCGTCLDSNDLSDCETCAVNSNRNSAPGCQCRSGFVDDGSNSECLECDKKC